MTLAGGSGELHYYSEKLTRTLETLCLARAAVIEAPSGYGKTTAVRDYLGKHLPLRTPVYWFTATDEEPAAGYRRLCREIEKIDPLAGRQLLQVGMPDPANVGYACDALRDLKCKNQAFLVLDNFHLMIDFLPFSFICALLDHGGEKLHLILLTQVLRRNLLSFIEGHGVFHITENALRFSAADIRSYYQAAGLQITEKDAAQVEHHTGGWVVAVYLNLCALREGRDFLGSSGILTLMEHLVWDKLTEEQRTFLLRLSPLEMVTLQEACLLSGCDNLSAEVLEALSIPFIRFDPGEGRYELHNIFSELLQKKRKARGAAFERKCLLRAGDMSREEGKSLRALDFYTRAKDWERILSLDLSKFYLETVAGSPFCQLAQNLAKNCTAEHLAKFPLSLLRLAFSLLTAGENRRFRDLMEQLRPLLSGDDEEGSYLAADWTLLSSFFFFPNITKMTAVLKKAAALFQGRPSRVIFPDSPWFYGVYSPVLTFHCLPGEAEREAEALAEYYKLYTGLTDGHGSGADTLFRAEYAHYAGKLDEAEILAYKAVFVAQSRKQELIRLTAAAHLALIAITKGDSTGWRSAIGVLTESSPAVLRRSFVLPSAVDTARSMLVSNLGLGDEASSEWLREGDFSGEQLPDLASQRLSQHLGFLLRQKKFARLVGTVEAAYPEGIKLERFGDLFIVLLAAAGYMGLNNRAKATELALRAVDFALADGLLSQLVFYNQVTVGLVEECIAREYPASLSRFNEVKKRMLAPFVSIYPELAPGELPDRLTEREREVAMLVAQGLSNEEVAQKLFLTVSTVRTHLRAVFKKLDIDRRTKLADKLR